MEVFAGASSTCSLIPHRFPLESSGARYYCQPVPRGGPLMVLCACMCVCMHVCVHVCVSSF